MSACFTSIHLLLNISWEILGLKPWDFYWLSQNPNITLEIVQNNLDKPWEYKWLIRNRFQLSSLHVKNFLESYSIIFKQTIKNILLTSLPVWYDDVNSAVDEFLTPF